MHTEMVSCANASGTTFLITSVVHMQNHSCVTMTSLLEPEFKTGYWFTQGTKYKITYRTTCSQVVVRVMLTDGGTFFSKKKKKKEEKVNAQTL